MSSARRDAALLLDVDGTLVDTAYLHTLAWQRACSANGFEVAAYRIHRLIGMGGDQFVPALLGEEVERELGDALRDAWQEHYEPLMPEARALPGAAELIYRAHDEGWRIVFASSSPAEHLEHYLELLGATGLRDRATTSDDVARTKPAPDIVALALEMAGTTARSSWATPRTTCARPRAPASAASACSPAATERPSCTRPGPSPCTRRPRSSPSGSATSSASRT